MQTTRQNTFFRFINSLTCAGLIFLSTASSLAFADDFENPKTHLQHVYQEFRNDLSTNMTLKNCDELAIKEYLSNKIGLFLSAHNLLTNMGMSLTRDSLSKMPEDLKNQLITEFQTFLIQDNLDAIKLFCSAKSFKTQTSEVDVTVSFVSTTIKLANNKLQRLDFLLLRGWDHWLIADIIYKNNSLEDRYRNKFSKTIITEGYAGLLQQLIEINKSNME
jgi:ABC-type transporter MlaC component